MKDNFEIVKLLLTNEKININIQNYLKNTSLHLAAKNGNIEIVRILIHHKGIKTNIKNAILIINKYNLETFLNDFI